MLSTDVVVLITDCWVVIEKSEVDDAVTWCRYCRSAFVSW